MNPLALGSPATKPTSAARHCQRAPANLPSQSETPQQSAHGAAFRLECWLLQAAGNPRLSISLWNTREISTSSGTANARLVIQDRPTLWRLLTDPLFQFGEAYGKGRIRIEGSLPDLMTVLFRSLEQADASSRLTKGVLHWIHRTRGNTLKDSRKNIHHHYDIGNDFYRLWLDKQMVYTCAYFARPSMTLEQAQTAKLDHVCRKLLLKPGDTVMEAGCGWGALAIHMAKHYGARVKAMNISRDQIEYANQWARREGLAGRVEFIEDDWRNMRDRCDVFVSVGMLEHVGRNNYRQFGDVIHRCLKPGGRGLIHSIGQNQPRPFGRWIERRIFPGAYPPTLRQMMDVLEPHELSVLDVENLRPHYAETLRHWLGRFEKHAQCIREMFDQQFVRIWRLYLAGSMAAFSTGGLHLFQIVFAREHTARTAWTRAHLYTEPRQIAPRCSCPVGDEA